MHYYCNIYFDKLILQEYNQICKQSMTLSKSDYMLFLKHPAWLWLKKKDSSKLPETDENTQTIFDAGHIFESYAEKLFPEAVRLSFNSYDEYLSLTDRTRKSIENGTKTIIQGRFEAGGITCIVDVLDRVTDDIFDLIEIKSATKAKPEHEYDLAFQLTVLEKAGIKVRNAAIIHANSEYVRYGEIEPEKLTVKTDVSGAVQTLTNVTRELIDSALKILGKSSIPDISPRYVNQAGISGVSWFSEWMDIYKSLVSDLNPYSIYYLSYPTSEQIGKLEDENIYLIRDIPEKFTLRPRQSAQIQTTKKNERIIVKEKIQMFLDTFVYPIYFLDYETFSDVIPRFDGCKPYGDYPFQYSLHILDSKGTEVVHKEYLHSENSNPMPNLLKKLRRDVGNTGTILSWNMSYEKGCHARMADLYPENKAYLDNLNERMNDLMTPFSEMWFVDKDFFGSASIKSVLPVLVPDLSYKELEVSDGMLARRTFTQTVFEGKNMEQREKILTDLKKYCFLDTFAMVKILEKLKDCCN